MTTRELLTEYASLLNKCGVDSIEAELFLDEHKFDQEFYELAQLSSKLKKALCTNFSDRAYSQNN